MIDAEEFSMRYKDAKWAEYKAHITLGGAGGIGSHLAFYLARIGHDLLIYDFDTVGNENIGGGQFYSRHQVGESKTSALRANIYNMVGIANISAAGEFKRSAVCSSIAIATFDNMESRMDMFQAWKDLLPDRLKGSLHCFINIATGPEQTYIEVVDRPSRIKRWEEQWQPSENIPDLPCTFKSTTHNAAMAASLGVAALNNVIFNHLVGERIRYVPFRMVVDLPLLTFRDHE